MKEPNTNTGHVVAGASSEASTDPLWIVEYGAISLPMGDPSRITAFEVYPTEEAAREGLKGEFNARLLVAYPPAALSKALGKE